ncbi:Valine--tRNA ligase [Halotydeus destructor]|nr:Valine--tRNA ligase [Halotydeus destructor]
MQTVIHNIRSLRAEYNLVKNKVKLCLKCDSEATRNTLRPFLSTIEVLTFSSEIEELPSDAKPPAGSAIVPISEVCEAYLMLKGVIDVKKETERLQTKKDKIEAPLKKLREAMTAPDYNDKVPSDVQESNSEKLRQLEGELQKVIEAVQTISLIEN